MKRDSKRQKLESDLTRYVESITTNFSAIGFRKRLAAWSVYAAAAASALALPNAAVADVLQVTGLPVTASAPFNGFASAGVNIIGLNGLSVAVRSAFQSMNLGHYLPATSNLKSARVKGNGLKFLGTAGGIANLLGSGAKVSNGAGAFQPGNGLLNYKASMRFPYGSGSDGMRFSGNWGSFGVGFVGFRFSTSNQVDYGYADVSVNGSAATLICAAYDDTGAAITTAEGCPAITGPAGVTPEPSTMSLALLAIGAAGVLALRRRKALLN